MKKSYTTPKAEKLKFDYTKVVTASFDPTDNPAGKGFAQDGCDTGHPGQGHKTYKKKDGCV